jgi:hypothetical protein
MFMKKYLFTIFLAAVAAGCHNDQSVGMEQAIINDAFVSIVDTTGYHYQSLRPAPNDSSVQATHDPVIVVVPELSGLSKWKTSIMASLQELKDDAQKPAYAQVIAKAAKDTATIPLTVSGLTQTGRYRLITKGDPEAKGTMVGQVAFSRVYRDVAENIGFVVATISDMHKSGITKVSFLQKTPSGWREVSNNVLEIW